MVPTGNEIESWIKSWCRSVALGHVYVRELTTQTDESMKAPEILNGKTRMLPCRAGVSVFASGGFNRVIPFSDRVLVSASDAWGCDRLVV